MLQRSLLNSKPLTAIDPDSLKLPVCTMADLGKLVVTPGDGEEKPAVLKVTTEPECPVLKRENLNKDLFEDDQSEDESQGKEQELPEPIRHHDINKRMMPCLPSINLIELTTILRDPSMPAQKILQEVADKIMQKSEESESDDGSVSSVSMKGVLDCIFDVSIKHEDTAGSDDDDGDTFERIHREIPCKFCNKVFSSTMMWNTHVLVAHCQQDPSVLNVRRTSTSDNERKDKGHSHRKHPRAARASSDTKDKQKLLKDSINNENVPMVDEHFSSNSRCTSVIKPQQREATVVSSDTQNVSPTSSQNEKSRKCSELSRCMVEDCEIESDKVDQKSHGNVSSDSHDQLSVASDIFCHSQIIEKSAENDLQVHKKVLATEHVGEFLNTDVCSDRLVDNTASSGVTQPGRKRKTSSPIPESVPSSKPSSSGPKRLRKKMSKPHVHAPQDKHSDDDSAKTP